MKKIFPILYALILIGCNQASNQDSGSSSPVSVTGSTEDGYVAGAIVWHDANNDRALTSGEPSAKTDDEGYFSESRWIDINNDSIKDSNEYTDYCKSNASDSDANHCLEIQVSSGKTQNDVIIRTQGGVDILTGEDFVGSISLKTNVSEQGINNVVATPLTSILSHMSTEEAQLFAESEGLSGIDNLNADFLEFTLNGDNATLNQAKLMRSALQAHKSVEMMNAVLLKRYSAIGELGMPTDASDFVYKSLAKQFSSYLNKNIDTNGDLSPTANFNDFITNPDQIISRNFILLNSENLLREHLIIEGKEEESFPISKIDVAGSLNSGIATKIKEVSDSIEIAMDIDEDTYDSTNDADALTTENAFARAKVIEIIKETVIDKIESIPDAVENSETQAIDDIDFTEISNQFSEAQNLTDDTSIFEGKDGLLVSEMVESIPNDGSLYDASAAVTNNTRSNEVKLKDNIDNKYFELSRFEDGEQGNLRIYFKTRIYIDEDGIEQTTNNEGDLEFCAKFDSGEIGNFKDESDDTRGLFFDGTWSVIKNEFIVQLTGNIGGSPKDITITSLGFQKDTDGIVILPKQRRFRADYNGKPDEWVPQIDFTTFSIEELPSSIDPTTVGDINESDNIDINDVCSSLFIE